MIGNRKIVQTIYSAGNHFALTDNGWVWLWCTGCSEWHALMSGN
jgi:hypothetical protein